ncbi:MAG: TraR/DksA C4-type zinc finger protein [Patescibacteria group bacterium]
MDINKFKQKLEKEKQDILKELETHKGVVDFGSDVDPDEETDESEEYSNEMSISQTLKERLSDIESALEKISNGEYGVCENCKKEISAEILEINPESRLCKECKITTAK